MMLKLGDVLDLAPETGDLVRVVWLSPDGGSAALYRLTEARAFPVLAPTAPLEERLRALEVRLVADDPFQVIAAEAKLKEGDKRRRDRAWELIKPLVENTPDIFSAHRRGALVKKAVEAARTGTNPQLKHTTVAQIYTYLRRYWQRGMTANALLPDFHNCGAPGKVRPVGEKKRGRPRKFGTQAGVNITPEMRRVFSVAHDRYYASTIKGKYTLKGAYASRSYCFQFVG